MQLTVDFSDRSGDIATELDLPKGSTVLNALETASNRQLLRIQFRGSGETAFVTSIDEIENEGAAGSNWVFYVNDELAKRGAGSFLLSNNDHLLWKFKKDGLK